MKKILQIIITASLASSFLPHNSFAKGYYTSDGLSEPEEYPTENIISLPSRTPTETATNTPSYLTIPANTTPIDYNGDESIFDPANDHRILANKTNLPSYEKNVFLYIEWAKCSPSIGSGAIVGNDGILTAAHNIYNKPCGGIAKNVTVKAGASNAGINNIVSNQPTSSSAKIYALTEYVDDGDRRYDLGFIKLKENLGKLTGTYGLATNAKVGDSIVISGYPGDVSADKKGNQYLATGKIQSMNDKLMFYHIDTSYGQSGSAIVRSGTNDIIGIHAHGINNYDDPSLPDNNNGIIITPSNISTIKHWIEKPVAQKYDTNVSISREDEKLWSNLDLTKYKDTTTGKLGKVYNAKYLYNHSNGYSYYSLYNEDGTWAGYSNIKHSVDLKPESFKKNITITKNGYDLWSSFYFNTKKGISDSYINKTLYAKYVYSLGNGRQYYSLYTAEDGSWLGYVNINATK